MLVSRPIIPIIKPSQSKKTKLQPKCRFCEHLSIFADWYEHELHICYKNYDTCIMVDDSPSEIGCTYFEWIDELKGLIK